MNDEQDSAIHTIQCMADVSYPDSIPVILSVFGRVILSCDTSYAPVEQLIFTHIAWIINSEWNFFSCNKILSTYYNIMLQCNNVIM